MQLTSRRLGDTAHLSSLPFCVVKYRCLVALSAAEAGMQHRGDAADVRAAFFLAPLNRVPHRLCGAVSIYEETWTSIRAEIEERRRGAHDVRMLLSPRCLAYELQHKVRVLVNLMVEMRTQVLGTVLTAEMVHPPRCCAKAEMSD